MDKHYFEEVINFLSKLFHSLRLNMHSVYKCNDKSNNTDIIDVYIDRTDVRNLLIFKIFYLYQYL